MMNQHGFCDVPSVIVEVERPENRIKSVSIKIYDADGSYTEFTVTSDAVHCGCMGLIVDRQYHVKEEPDWIDLEMDNAG
jgi:hypothetical protein